MQWRARGAARGGGRARPGALPGRGPPAVGGAGGGHDHGGCSRARSWSGWWRPRSRAPRSSGSSRGPSTAGSPTRRSCACCRARSCGWSSTRLREQPGRDRAAIASQTAGLADQVAGEVRGALGVTPDDMGRAARAATASASRGRAARLGGAVSLGGRSAAPAVVRPASASRQSPTVAAGRIRGHSHAWPSRSPSTRCMIQFVAIAVAGTFGADSVRDLAVRTAFDAVIVAIGRRCLRAVAGGLLRRSSGRPPGRRPAIGCSRSASAGRPTASRCGLATAVLRFIATHPRRASALPGLPSDPAGRPPPRPRATCSPGPSWCPPVRGMT